MLTGNVPLSVGLLRGAKGDSEGQWWQGRNCFGRQFFDRLVDLYVVGCLWMFWRYEVVDLV